MLERTSIFRHSRWDALSLAVIPFQVGCFVSFAVSFPGLSPLALAALVPALFALSLQSSGANHNHYHTAIFRVRWLNAAARIGFSMVGGPKTPHNIGHGLHHATNRSWNGTSVLRIIGLNRPLHKQLLAFGIFLLESFGLKHVVLLILLRHWPADKLAATVAPEEHELATRVFRKLKERGTLRAAQLDIAAWVSFRILLCAIDWRFFLFYFVPVQFCIDTLRQAENYVQHWGATDPEDPRRDSVSCYGKLYNWLTFNLGYHQEHHYRPGAHWLQLPRIREELPLDRRQVPLTHYTNLPLFFPSLATELQARVTSEPVAVTRTRQ